jgi:hypothetical protein
MTPDRIAVPPAPESQSMHGSPPFTARFELLSTSKLLPETAELVGHTDAPALEANIVETVGIANASVSAENALIHRLF